MTFFGSAASPRLKSGKIIEKVLMEEGRPPESIFDLVQGITRLARDKTQQDARLEYGRACQKKLLDGWVTPGGAGGSSSPAP